MKISTTLFAALLLGGLSVAEPALVDRCRWPNSWRLELDLALGVLILIAEWLRTTHRRRVQLV
jgi:hypothetical protein